MYLENLLRNLCACDIDVAVNMYKLLQQYRTLGQYRTLVPLRRCRTQVCFIDCTIIFGSSDLFIY